MWFRTAFLQVLLFLFVFGSAQAGTYYVRPSGNDGNDGRSSLSPWRTIAKANASLVSGDTVLVGAGTYSEVILPNNQGSPGASIVYLAIPGEEVIVEGVKGELEVVRVGSYTVVEGFNIRNQSFFDFPNTVAYWVNLAGSNILLRHCRIVAEGDAVQNLWVAKASSRGISLEGRWITVEDCLVRGLNMGIVFGGGSPRNYILRRDTIYATLWSNVTIISPTDGSDGLQGNLVEYCVMDTSFGEDNIQFEPNYSDHSRPANRGTIIRKNRLGHAGENCVDLKGTALIVIEDNLLYSSTGDNDGPFDGSDDIGGGAIALGNGDVTQDDIVRRNAIWDNHGGIVMYRGMHVYNNILMNNRRSYRGPNSTAPESDFSNVVSWNMPERRRGFMNNIVMSQPNVGVFTWKMDNGDKFLLDNNLYFDESGPVKFYNRQNDVMVTNEGLPTWKNLLGTWGPYGYIEGKDVNSIEANPQFVNVPMYPADYDPSWDFSLGPNSPARNNGRPVASAIGDGVNSTTVVVDDPYFFTDGFGIAQGDTIRIGSAPAVQIVTIDYDTGTITLSAARSWRSGDGVHTQFSGAAPDIGANEFPQDTDTTQKAPVAPSPAFPLYGAVVPAENLTIHWHPVAGSVDYQLQLATDAGFSSVVVNEPALRDTSHALPALSSGTVYYYRLRSIEQGIVGQYGSAVRFSTVTVTTPAYPSSAYPLEGAVIPSENISIRWHPVDGSIRYQLQVAEDAGFGTVIVNDESVRDTSLAVPKLAEGKKYYYRLRSFAPSMAGEFGPAVTFSTLAAVPAIPSVAYPSDGMMLEPGNVSIRWRPVPGAVAYNLQLSEDASFGILAVNDSSLVDTSLTAANLAAGKTFFFRVKAIGAVPGQFSSPVRFITATTTVSQVPLDFKLDQNYPNPFNPDTRIRYTIPVTSNVVLRVYDLLGREVALYEEGVKPAGIYEITFSARGLSSGIYYYTLKTDTYVETRRMTLLR